MHGVDMELVEEGCWVVDSGQKLYFGGLSDLALVAGLHIPFHVGVESRPPEMIQEGVACGVKTLVAELVMHIVKFLELKV